MQYVRNLTPHTIRVYRAGDWFRDFPPDGLVLRAEEKTISVGTLVLDTKDTMGATDVPSVIKFFGRVENVPEERDDTVLVVSNLVAQKLWAEGRRDVYTVGSPVRGAAGEVVGCREFCGNPFPPR